MQTNTARACAGGGGGWAVWVMVWMLNVDRASDRAAAFVRAASHSQDQARRRRVATSAPRPSTAAAPGVGTSVMKYAKSVWGPKVVATSA